jgi:hypothetical protein
MNTENIEKRDLRKHLILAKNKTGVAHDLVLSDKTGNTNAPKTQTDMQKSMTNYAKELKLSR